MTETDIVERLGAFDTFLKSEELMSKWSRVRCAIADGDRSSGPRDAFESWIDDEGALAEAVAEILALRAALAAERERCERKVMDFARRSFSLPLRVAEEIAAAIRATGE